MRKRFTVILLIIVIIISVVNIPVLAASEVPAQVAGDKAVAHNTTDSLKSQINSEDAKSDDYLIQEWYCEIRAINSGQVSLYGWTQCVRDCDSVTVELRLQRWNGSSWSTIGTYVFESFDTDYSWGIRTVSVSGGKYYRVKSYHRARDGSLYDQTTAITQAIYVN